MPQDFQGPWVLRRHFRRKKLAAVVVAPSPLLYMSPQQTARLTKKTAGSVRELRVKFDGREFPEAALEFSPEIGNAGLHFVGPRNGLLSPLTG